MIRILTLVAAASAQPAFADDAKICITNGDAEELLFVADAHSGPRVVERLKTDESLCAMGQSGTVSVFLDEDAIEGCSRLTTAGQIEELIEYTNFDTCRWKKTPRP